jgi:YD repeat-containing protein
MGNRHNPAGCQKYVSAARRSDVQGSGCTFAGSNLVGDPINPASGAVCHTEVDAKNAGQLGFKRFYNSSVSVGGTIGPGWRHSFSSRIKPKYSGSTHLPYVPDPVNSSLYNTEALACTSGFVEIKGQVSTWANATASYSGGICKVSVGSTQIATLPILYMSTPTPVPGVPVLIGLDATRDDGQLISFKAPPSIAMKLQQVSGGYTLTDADDNVESYNADGRLLSIASRSGVVRTMSYDTAGRLSTVTDSFGHVLTLTYDSQNRLSSVTSQ